MKRAILILLGLCFCSATIQAQSYSIDWFSIDGGGGNSTGGVYSVDGGFTGPSGKLMPAICRAATLL